MFSRYGRTHWLNQNPYMDITSLTFVIFGYDRVFGTFSIPQFFSLPSSGTWHLSSPLFSEPKLLLNNCRSLLVAGNRQGEGLR